MFLWNARTNQRHTHVGNGVEFWNLADFSCNESKLFKINLQIYSNKIVSKNLSSASEIKEGMGCKQIHIAPHSYKNRWVSQFYDFLSFTINAA